jgi:hypothetical protein
MNVLPAQDELTELVHDFFASRDLEVSYDPETGLGTYGEAQFSVRNLAQNLAKIDRERWSEYVAWHFGRLVEGPPEVPSNYEKARRQLRVRLASTEMAKNYVSEEALRPVADDLHEVLMITVDKGAMTVPPDSIKEWGQPLDQLWNDARKHTLLDEPRERQALLRPNGEQFTWVRGSWWVASLLLDLGRYLSPQNQHGAIAMVPVRDALLFHEITDAGVVHSVGSMVPAGLQFYFEGPDPISPHVYWWRNSEIRRIVAYEDEGLKPVWDSDFSRMLADVEAATVVQDGSLN